jgi:hypothetical protein
MSNHTIAKNIVIITHDTIINANINLGYMSILYNMR